MTDSLLLHLRPPFSHARLRNVCVRRYRGLTLIELLVVLAVVGVLLTVGVPSFFGLMQTSRAVSSVNSFHAALQLARSEAVRRGVRVSVCPSDENGGCIGGVDFSGGWAVVAGAQPFDASAETIRIFAPPSPQIDIRFHFGPVADAYISYVPTGETRSLSGALLMGSVRFCTGDDDRRIVVNRAGRPRAAVMACDA